MNTAEIHTIEHLGATFLRNHETAADQTIYFGPMGCRTGFYLILKGDLKSSDIVELVKETFELLQIMKVRFQVRVHVIVKLLRYELTDG